MAPRCGKGRLRLLAAVSLLLCAFGPVDAHAQLRGIGGGASVGSATGSGLGSGVVGNGATLPGLPGNGPALPSRQDGINLGVTIPSNFGSPTLPSLPAPDPIGTVTNPGTITNTLTSPLPNLGRATGGTPVAQRRSGVPPVGERRYVPDEVVVRLPSNLSPQALDDLARRHRLARVESQTVGLIGGTFHRWRITDRRSVSDVIRAIETDGGASGVQPNYRFTLQQGQSADATELETLQYALAKLHLPQAHRFATGDKVLVALIDSGIDTTHPEIAGLIADSFDATNSMDSPHSHGTAMAGAIIAHGRLKGVAPAARILAARAFDPSGTAAEGTTLTILRSIDWAVARGARVINMSFAGPHDPEIARGLAAAQRKGVVLVAAAGNAGPKSPPLYPAADPNVIAVTATDAQDNLLPVASRGRHIAVAAPGVDILAPAPGGGYQLSTGTSIAAAEVSGVAALLLEFQPGLKPDALRKILLSTAADLGPKGRDDQFGAGLADAHRAILSLNAASAARTKPTNVSVAR
jgi:subtilisin family serine protease